MARRAQLTAALLALVVPLVAGCGGGSKNAAAPLPKAPTLTVPGEKTTPSVAEKSKTTTTDTTTSTATSTTPTTTTQPAATSTPGGGAAPPQTGGASPGTQTQTTSSPSGGTPAQRFEQFCKDNPGAC